ncbi:5738_t:CDS:2 [Diversispora eburnea]|uniref:Probable electron transfer flavoprotein subunit beta n=1 Tax=Diversispora eburnea TaxID=1213867 RepID=A0A9N8YJ29_9GLOM|nr:5738_t:CDS:2 [Diversispora eburnea]
MTVLKILVGCKRVIDFAVKIRVNSARTAVETANIKHSLNPFDEIGVQEAINLREVLGKDKVSEIIALTCGPSKSQEQLRTALAMGADRAIHVETSEDQTLEPLNVAKIFKAIIEKENPNLVILGKQAIDDDSNQTGQMLAVDINEDNITVTREVDGGLETIRSKLPAIVTTDLRLNEPKFVTLPNIMKARKKPLTKFSLQDFNIDVTPRLEIISVTEPSTRQSGTRVDSVDDLISKLKSAGALE